MNSRWNGAIALILVALLALGASCSGGDGGPVDPIGEAFNLLITANPDSGPAPLTVTFFAVPSGGQEPYSYRWDFNNDGVADSNSNSGIFSYTASGQATVAVTDAAGDTVTASKTIIVTAGGPPPGDDELDVRFDVTPKSGVVPFNAQFTAFVSGGEEPYSYSWDFDGDGTFDSFIRNPLWTFEEIGQEILPGTYAVVPVLQVEDSRGVIATNLDDKNNDGNPDFRLVIVANPPAGGLIATASANPVAGQAPLTVEFTGSAANGSDNYQFKWSFGDNSSTEYAVSSIATHTYMNPGNYLATVTVKDMTTGAVASSAPITISATVDQVFEVTINSDLTSGQVPFVVNFSINPVNGQEPIIYRWDVFDDVTSGDPEPSVTNPPTLDAAAVVTPDFTFRKNPSIHFANTASGGATYSYAVRCVATDAAGNNAVSNLIRVVASEPGPGAPVYEAYRPNVVAVTEFPDGSGHPTITPVTPSPWGARANAAACAHPSGISFLFGGEILDESGQFERLVLRGDSVYMHVPNTASTGTNEGNIGKFNTGTLGGGMVRLNDWFSPPFPGPADRPMPPVPTMRSAAFTIVGSAAAVLIHEVVESNPAGAYQSARNEAGYPYPDSPQGGWGLDNPMGGDSSGLGSPVIYVLGGRVAANQPVDLVQKYYVYGFGSEDLPYDSVDFGFQTTGNQTDTWSPHFLRPDTDQYPAPDADPQVPDRRPATNLDEALPILPEPLYGLMACSMESGVDQTSPSFPNGPYHYIFTFGGIGPDGGVRDEMRWWNATQPGSDTGGDEQPNGVFSLVARMPTARAYGKAVVVQGSTGLKIALVGGIDDRGIPIDTIDVFSFGSADNPSTGSWETFAGTLPEALEACGAGFHPGPGDEEWVLTFGGWTGQDYNFDVYNARLFSEGDLVIREAVTSVPRNMVGSSQSNGSNPLLAFVNITHNRYYVFGGVDENGSDSVVEVLSLP